jgi:hypothetical protein
MDAQSVRFHLYLYLYYLPISLLLIKEQTLQENEI